MVWATEFGANDWVASWPGWGKAELGWLPRNDILFEAELRNPEGMDHIFCFHAKGDWPIGWNVKFT